ncbi:MAG: Lon protease family protein [Bacillota bacterium]
MRERLAIPPEHLRRAWDPNGLGFATTAELPELEGLVGQEQAVAALQFGLSIRSPGYNIYVAGPSGTGKTSYTSSLVQARAESEIVPGDWIYVYNFDRPDEPLAIVMPAGSAPTFAREMEEIIHDAQAATGRALNSKEHQARREELLRGVRSQMEKVMSELEKYAQAHGFGLTQTQQGLMPVPVLNGQPMSEEQFEALPPEKKREITERAQEIQRAVTEAGRRTWETEKLVKDQLRHLDHQVASGAVAPMIAHLKGRYKDVPRLVEWLTRVEQELIGPALPEPAPTREMEEAAAAEMRLFPQRRRRADPFARFRVNVFVHRRGKKGSPVVVETHPTYANLFGKAEYVTQSEEEQVNGFMQIKAGAIHRANGGYLILQAADVLSSPYAWEALKRALTMREARIEAPGTENRILPVETVRPQPIALDLKVILIGNTGIYHALYAMDEGFRKQFKFKAEFDIAMVANEHNAKGYASFIAQVCRREKQRHLTAAGVSRVLEHSHRLSDDQTKLSARFNEVVEVIYEANAWASQAGSTTVDSVHVERAIAEKAARSSLPEQRLLELIQRGTMLFDVSGQVVGQVNGLTVMNIGDYRFGSPSRITARVYMGHKGILHIEREIEMSGQIHDKGLFTLTGYLGDRFAQNKPLAFSASVAFEQTYVPVDGDSASSTELYALLSALAEVPIDQSIAVTGSVNQRGEIQPIGGVNEKIEGFFRVCKVLGLTGRQGVMIPQQNRTNLVLSHEVVDAVRAGQFHIWAVGTIEEGIEILTGIPAGERQPDGRYTPDSIFDRVDRRIEQLARSLYAWNRGERAELL